MELLDGGDLERDLRTGDLDLLELLAGDLDRDLRAGDLDRLELLAGGLLEVRDLLELLEPLVGDLDLL